MSAVVRVEHVSKKFSRSLKAGMMYTARDVTRELVGLPLNADALRPREFWALDDISFELQAGESLGLLGLNGSGKSTLLKLLNGILRPDKGRIEMRGRIGALIEVGAGFHPMLSGRENVYVNGAILGMSKREVDRKFDEIVAFSELDPAVLDAPIKSYSSGMYVRLGFSVAIHCQPDILLIDEVLSVGDLAFTAKCRRRIQELRAQGVTFLIVSHHLPTVEETCDNALLLQKGRIIDYGPTRETITRLRLTSGVGNDLRLVRSAGSGAENGSKLAGNAEQNRATPQNGDRTAQGTEAGGQEAPQTARGAAVISVQIAPEEAERTFALCFEADTSDEAANSRSNMTTVPCGSTQTVRIQLSTGSGLEKALLLIWMTRTSDELVACSGQIRIPEDMPPLPAGLNGEWIDIRLPFAPFPGEYRLGVTLCANGPLDVLDEAFSPPFEITSGPIVPVLERGDSTAGVCAVPVECVGASPVLIAQAA